APVTLEPPPKVIATFYNQIEAGKACADGHLVVTREEVPTDCVHRCPPPEFRPRYDCYGCPTGPVYDLSQNRCVSCPAGSVVQSLPDGNAGTVPDVLSHLHTSSVRCVSCDAPKCAATDPSHGIMDWIPTAQGRFCSRCREGDQLYSCTNDEQCELFGNDARCASRGWPSDDTRVCVEKCVTDYDCPGGTCVGQYDCTLPGSDCGCHDPVDIVKEVPSGFGLL